MEDVRIRFGRAVRNRRARLGVSQEEFADMCGMDRTYIGGIEHGERNVSLVNIEKITLTFKVSLSELFRGITDILSIQWAFHSILRLLEGMSRRPVAGLI
jgi:transcriptional regulator with XRE-family HTH domain